MGNGTIGKGPSGPATPAQISTTAVDDQKPAEASTAVTPDQSNQQTKSSSNQTGRVPQGLAHDPSVAMKKATLAKSVDSLKTPSKAQLEEIKKAMQEGKKEDAVKLTIKYYGIDTSPAAEVRYRAPKKGEAIEQGTSKAPGFEKIDTATKMENGKLVIDIGDESFQFKGKDSPEWLASSIYHESFHAKNHFNPNEKPVMKPDPQPAGPANPKMSQEEVFQEIEAYQKELSAVGKLGLSNEEAQEIQHRQDQLRGQLTDENRETVFHMQIKKQPWPHM